MPAECIPKPMRFARLKGRDLVADFRGGALTSDAGALLLGAVEAHHRHGAPLAGKSTLNRLEHAPTGPHRYRRIGHDPEAIETLLVDLFLEAHAQAPKRLVLDLDATDDPLHERQEGRFFHGYYDCYCYLPLYIFCGDHLLAAKLRRANIDASAGRSAPTPQYLRRLQLAQHTTPAATVNLLELHQPQSLCLLRPTHPNPLWPGRLLKPDRSSGTSAGHIPCYRQKRDSGMTSA